MIARLDQLLAGARQQTCLTTLNLGLGRDSMAMLCLLFERALVVDGAPIGPEAVDAVVFSDTGAEWRHTYRLIPIVEDLCRQHGVRFLWLKKPPDDVWRNNLREAGSRALPAWCKGTEDLSIEDKARRGAYHYRLPIIAEYMRYGKIAVTCSASCTDNHKVGPIRRCMDDLCRQRFGVGTRSWGHAVRTGLRPRHRVLIGIAADEASRAIDTGRPSYERPVYPLVDMGIDKADEGKILARWGLDEITYKSGCIMCPYQPLSWYWMLRETDPDLFAEVVHYEQTAADANPKMRISRGKALPVAVDEWRERNPDATIDAVRRKAYVRGCAKPPVETGRGHREAA